MAQPLTCSIHSTFSQSHLLCTGKGKGHPITGHKGPEGEQRYSSTISLTSSLDGMGCQCHTLATLPPPGKTQYPFYRRLDGPQGRSGRVLKISPPPGFDPRTVQSVLSRYTVWAIPARSPSLYPYNHPLPTFIISCFLRRSSTMSMFKAILTWIKCSSHLVIYVRMNIISFCLVTAVCQYSDPCGNSFK